MTIRLFTSVLALCTAAFLVRAADEENPYKNVKVGDFAIYKTKIKVESVAFEGTSTQSITGKTDTEATVTVKAAVGGTETPPTEQKIDLTKPYDPTKLGALPKDTTAEIKKEKDGTEKIKVGAKEHDCTWTTYKITGSANGMDINADVKVWMAKDVPMGMVKMEMKGKIGKKDMMKDMTIEMELSDFGNNAKK